MKIIDLLNNFGNKRKIPVRIKVKHGLVWDYYKWDVENQWYVTLDNSSLLRVACSKDLLEEVEILEEEKKIPEKIFLEDMYALNEVKAIDMELENKINEIIDYLKSKGDE